jgi:hypothetical protein
MPSAAPIWSALSRLRRARIFHPDGVAYAATLVVPGNAGTGAPLFDQPRTHRCTVRLSRGVGLPRPLPDTLGLAVRIEDAYGRQQHQDFLMNTSIDAPILHHLILPGLVPGQSYSSVLAYRIAGRLRIVGAIPRGQGAFDLALAPLDGRLSPVARLTLAERLPGEIAERIRFNPWHTGPNIQPAGPFQRLRGQAYPGSQEGRERAYQA